ncbi:aldo/keto reductase [Luteibacter aegosomaticola]|uniref:aldo/keto reductase n=1 Tax=Luteibacter aegosomaticola TaxID=2911538 RepID=UPI001FF95B68|nr:aldo/keto reductase [Luteibacter aegosomaticola]UPG88916.1 aldo/keto reductase [Luteibacter aegosomaticola]
MRYKLLGRHTGLRVSEIAFGVALFGNQWGYGSEPADARRVLDRYLAAGGNFLDTADGYQFGQSESVLGDLIAPIRDEIVLASKYSGGAAKEASLAFTGNSRKNMVYSVEQSLRRLKTDRLDLYWVHHSDNVTPFEEILRGLDDLVRAGKVLYVGVSNFPAWRISRAALLADLRGWAPLAAVQFEYSLVERGGDRELMPMAEALGLAALLWSPLAGGLLTGKYRAGEQGRLQGLGRVIRTEKSQRDSAVVDAVIEAAGELGVTAAEVSLAWILARARRSTTSVLPIIGPRTVEQLENNLAALDVILPEELIARLDEVSQSEPGAPFDVNASTLPRMLGGRPELIDLPVTPAI